MTKQEVLDVVDKNVGCLVACSGSKVDGRSPAWKLYDSTLFEKSFAAAVAVGVPYVMSAKHGIVAVDDRLDPYNETLKNYSAEEKTVWAKELEMPSFDTLVLFGGRDYVEPIKEEYGDKHKIVDAYDNCSGIGVQMGVAGDIVEEITND
jgi:hypothetical protein